MRLGRITRVGLAELRRGLAAGDELTAVVARAEAHWFEPHPADIEMSSLGERVPTWDAQPENDADNAIELHDLLRLPRRVAADRMIWPWLAGLQFAAYTQARWSGEGRRFNPRRIGTDHGPNAFGRLWWAAELTRVENPRPLCDALELDPSDDPYHFMRLLLDKPAVHQELTFRNELNDRAKLIAFLAFVHHDRLVFAKIREAAKALNLLFSTTIVGGFDRAGPEAGRHHVDPIGCRRLLDYLRARLQEPDAPQTVGSPETPAPGRGRLFSWLRGGKTER